MVRKWMSDKLQLVISAGGVVPETIDKLEFVGHLMVAQTSVCGGQRYFDWF
jgi:hypothetical protein